MIKTNNAGYIESAVLNGKEYRFDGKGPSLFGFDGVDAKISWEEKDSTLILHVTVHNGGNTDFCPDRAGVYLGIDSYMEKYPDWNDRLFPTMLRCEKTHFYGYFMSPEEKILGVVCPLPMASYKLMYNGLGHRIYSAELDLLNAKRQPPRHTNGQSKMLAGETLVRDIYLFSVENLSVFDTAVEKITGAPVFAPKKYTVEIGEKIISGAKNGCKVTVKSPTGKVLSDETTADEYGIYLVRVSKNDKTAEGCVYCRRSWSYYLKAARRAAVEMPQKATTHCESWYGLFSGYLAAKHYPDAALDGIIEANFREIMPYLFDFKSGTPIIIPSRIQNTAATISLLCDRYETGGEGSENSLDIADRLADFLIKNQKSDGAYYKNSKEHYTCVIYIAKSMLELYVAEKDKPEYAARAVKHFKSAKAAIDNLVEKLDNIGTEGEQTFEDGMISCSALQIGMFALLLDEIQRAPYTKAAEYMMSKHACLEQKKIPDCRMRNGSLRYWEAQYDVQAKANMMNSPHGWTAWTLYAKYYLYLLTGKEEYLTDLMDGIGACAQLISSDGELRWGFICDPCVNVPVFVKDKKLENGYSGKFENRTIGEEYLPMISGWFRHGKQRVTGGFLECPLILENDREVVVDTQGGCCDNDVHEVFKCMEETVLEKAFLHECSDGTFLCYSCKLDNGTFTTDGEAKLLCSCLKSKMTVKVGEKTITLPVGVCFTQI